MKKFFSLVLAMLMCVCLMAGCGQAEDPAEEPSEAPASGEPAAEEPSGEEEPAAEGTAFKFGGVGPLTGDNA
ncbi:MAG TPA: amino acid ABC transporter substrate-binding protein, partial [Candidatus Scatomorpha stercorigallinarum]|nr:amino acid ABC transporter substrate-binding protein [Candidatus Scatomorpha stercorigallinarum]